MNNAYFLLYEIVIEGEILLTQDDIDIKLSK